MAQYNWGPHYLVPSKGLSDYGGCVLLREKYDEELLRRQLDDRGLPWNIVRITNSWFCRKKDTETWTKIGESSDIGGGFPVSWDTTTLEDGAYEIIGFMQAFIQLTKWDDVGLASGEYDKWYKPIRVRRPLEKRVLGVLNSFEVTVRNVTCPL